MTPEMLREQFEFLLQYHGFGCAVYGCQECARMAEIRRLLEIPFENPLTAGASS